MAQTLFFNDNDRNDVGRLVIIVATIYSSLGIGRIAKIAYCAAINGGIESWD
jgi:hypothetical protein